MLTFVIFTLTATEIAFVKGFDWCSLTCNGQQHTMCKYTTDKCQGSLSDSDKTLILDMHNRMRSDIATGNNTDQPTASNMGLLTWHEEAAQIAERWAQQCELRADTCRLLQNGEKLGQNVAMEGSADSHTAADVIRGWVQKWFDDRKNLNEKNIDSFLPDNFNQVGRYSQLAWAETRHIGCGFGAKVEGGYNQWFLVCNYHPSGNIGKVPMYLRGAGCSQCPEGTSCSDEYPGLCASLGLQTLSALTTPVMCVLFSMLYVVLSKLF